MTILFITVPTLISAENVNNTQLVPTEFLSPSTLEMHTCTSPLSKTQLSLKLEFFYIAQYYWVVVW
jgi:hypothetical protein